MRRHAGLVWIENAKDKRRMLLHAHPFAAAYRFQESAMLAVALAKEKVAKAEQKVISLTALQLYIVIRMSAVVVSALSLTVLRLQHCALMHLYCVTK